MTHKVDNSGSAFVNKNFVSQHTKEFLLVAGLVAGVALGLFVSPDIGIGVGAVVAFMYGASKLLSPPTYAVNKITKENCEQWPDFDVTLRPYKEPVKNEQKPNAETSSQSGSIWGEKVWSEIV